MAMEILGEDGYYVLGDDSYDVDALLGYDEMGAFPRRMPARQAKNRMLVAKRGAMPVQRAMVRSAEPTKSREFPLGCNSTAAIAAGASSTISVQPQVAFRPERFAVASSIAANFTIDDIKIGKNSQLISADSIPAEAVSSLAVGVTMRLDTVNIGQLIAVNVTNISAAATWFYSAFIGTAIE